MNESASIAPRVSAPASSLEVGAVLLLDAAGVITEAGPSAAAWWGEAAGALAGRPFVTLFAFEVTSSDPEFLAAQWDVVLASALDRVTPLAAQPREGEPVEVRVRLEARPTSGYIATVAGAAPPKSSDLPAGGAPADVGMHLLAQHASAGFFDLHLAAGTYHFSAAWKKLLGYAPGELPDTLETWHRLVHPDDSGAAPDKLGRKLAPGLTHRPVNVEFRMQHRLGHWVWVQCIGVQLLSATGELQRVVGFHLDVSERKDLEEASLLNDARVQDLTGAGPLPAFELDFANGIFWYSPAWEKLLGHAEGTLPATAAAFATALPPEESTAGAEAWLLARAPGQSSSLELARLRDQTGKPVRVLLGLHRTITRKRELVRVVGFAVPIPPEALAEEGALPSLLTQEAFHALAEAVIVTDPRGKILFANATAARLLRSSQETLRQQPLGDVLRLVNRQSGRPTDDPVDRALSADGPLGLFGEDALLGAEGQPRIPVVWTARAIFGADNKARGVALIFRNPEEMTLSPEELLKANRFESLGLLAGGIAHDFNNLLTTILGAVSLARDNRDYSALDDADQACSTAKGLTKQLLAFAKGGAGTQTVCHAKDILADSIRVASAGATAEITLDVADGAEPVQVDRAQILQVFQNLIVNALQAMPPPPHRPRLQIRAANVAIAENQVPGLGAGTYVEFEVRDNGSGIKPEHVEKIFDPFFTTKKHGTGLGLATVLSIVRKHGGQIGLDTQVGVGTAFTVYLPKADKPVDVQARRAPSLRFGTGRVLFMDDDPKISTLTANMLQSLDYKFDLAKNGDEAITLYKRYLNIGRPYDAVIMDLTVVGGMGGEECFSELRKLDPDVRAIVASGYDNDEMAKQFFEKGWCGYLTKPYRVNDLGKVLKTVLG